MFGCSSFSRRETWGYLCTSKAKNWRATASPGADAHISPTTSKSMELSVHVPVSPPRPQQAVTKVR